MSSRDFSGFLNIFKRFSWIFKKDLMMSLKDSSGSSGFLDIFKGFFRILGSSRDFFQDFWGFLRDFSRLLNIFKRFSWIFKQDFWTFSRDFLRILGCLQGILQDFSGFFFGYFQRIFQDFWTFFKNLLSFLPTFSRDSPRLLKT